MANPAMSHRAVCKMLGIDRKYAHLTVKKPHVQIELKKRQAKAVLKSDITLHRIMLEESCIVFSTQADFIDEDGVPKPPQDLSETALRAVKKIKTIPLPRKAIGKDEATGEILYEEQKYIYEYDLWDKGKASERVSKHLGLYEKDNVQKAVRIYFLSADDKDVPQIEEDPDIIDAEFKKISGDKPIALLE